MKKIFVALLLALCFSIPSQLQAQTVKGDLNGDGEVSAADISALIDHLLSGTAIDEAAADVDESCVVAPADVSVLIDYLLNGMWPSKVYTVNGMSFTMQPVDGGTFMMGSNNAYPKERPVHQVTVSSYSICMTQVTQELWVAVMGSNPSWFSSRKGYTDNLQRPVECVTWNDCQTFITRLNELTGMNFRLPTEAEWEFAARGGNMKHGYTYAGSNDIDEVAWYTNNSSDVGSSSPDYGTHPVAQKKPNELGLYDMSGNVYEWCQDRFGEYSSEAQTDPTGATSGNIRVMRGGAWICADIICTVCDRGNTSASDSWWATGLRLAL